MRGINKGFGGSSSALFFILGGMVGATLSIFSGFRENLQTGSRLNKMAGAEKENFDQYSNIWMGKEINIEQNRMEIFDAHHKKDKNRVGRVIEPLMTEEDYTDCGVILD